MNQKVIHPLPTTLTHTKPIHYSMSSPPKIVTSIHLPPFFLIDNKSFIDEKKQCVYDCKLTALETNTIKS